MSNSNRKPNLNGKANNPHAGHRARLRERARKEGLQAFEPHQVLELLLCYTIPRRETNTIAHALIERFDSLKGVFDADIEELKQIDGISDASALFLKLMPSVVRLYLMGGHTASTRFPSAADVGNYLMTYYIGQTREMPVILLLNANRELLSPPIPLCEGTVSSSTISIQQILRAALRENVAGVILAHNHPAGEPIPSAEDIRTTRDIRMLLHQAGSELIEHIVVGRNGFRCISELEAMYSQSADWDEASR